MQKPMHNLILQTFLSVLLIHPLSLSAQNSFSVSLDVDSSAGDQAVTSVNVSADQIVAIQIFGKDIQNANGLAVRSISFQKQRLGPFAAGRKYGIG